ncbi:MAG: S8 family peptidase [Phycisphaerae bacterium]|nr:S8 family peptidase [Phycisphaerae bacterium]
MARHRHVFIAEPGEARSYTTPSRGGGEFKTPPRDRRAHAEKLVNEVRQARKKADALAEETGHVIRDICLEIFGEQDFDLKVESLEDLRLGVELRSVCRREKRLYATIYVPGGKLENFVRKITRYQFEDNQKSGRPKNEDLVAGISGIRFPILRSFWTDDEDLFPTSENESIWWEVWVRVEPSENPDAAFAAFVAATADSDLRLSQSQHVVRFPERLVFLAFGSSAQWMAVFVPLLDRLAELRRAKEVPTEFLNLEASDQRAFVEDLAGRLVLPAMDAPTVCLLDFGVRRDHPLLRPLLAEEDAHAFDPTWPAVDASSAHGTEMAGLAIFGDELPTLLTGNQRHPLAHRLESVRMLHSNHPHPEDAWGYVTQESLARAEARAPRRRRVACLPVSAVDQGRDHGRPTSWSAAVDQHAAGQLDDLRRLYVVSAGNIRDIPTNAEYSYPDTNLSDNGIEDPGQSWNALTVGAYTDRVQIRSSDREGHQPVARRGGLCPTSRTSVAWVDRVWPLKPDIVLEGGNYVRSPSGQIDGCDDLALLTTSLDSTGRLLTWTSDTSAATAQAARLAAILMADYPGLWPETIRGLLVHSARWTDEMCNQMPGRRQEDLHRRLRCFGYGVPDLDAARYTIENNVSLVHQGELQPYEIRETVRDGAKCKQDRTKEFRLHSLPWPKEALEALHHQDVTVRVTLSYFIEPSPAGRGWGKKFRYASHGLRFAVRGPTETDRAFRKRISTQEWDEEEGRPSTADPIDWKIGSRLRTRGSIHCDWWTASGADVARCGQVAVFPVTGWWRERKHLGCVGKKARYSLIISISTPATDVDLYTPIAQEVGLVTEIIT